MKKYTHLQWISICIRSAIFSIFMTSFTVMYSLFCITIKWLPFRYRYAIISLWCKTILGALKCLCHIDYTIEGLDNIPQDKVGIILCKHQSTWETFLIPTLFHHCAIILKKELLWVPFFGWGLSIIDPIAINRKDPRNAMDQVIAKGKNCLAKGRWILIFPEGTRISPGHTGKYRLGGTRLATATDAPIVPIAHNAGYFWPKRGFIKKPGTIKVIIGKPIMSDGQTPEEIMEKVKTWIEDTVKTISE